MASALVADTLVGVAEAAGMLRVSAATVRNWLKSGRIAQSASDERGRPQFSVKYLEGVRAQAQRDARSKGRPRRGGDACQDKGRNAQAVEAICSAARGRGALYMRAALCEAALRLMCRSGIVLNTSPRSGETCLAAWARGGIERAEAFEELLLGLLSDYRADRIREAAQALPEFKLDPSGNVLGMLYSSFLQMEGDEKGRPPYAPSDLCDRVASDLGNGRDVFLDPCCGSGGFILALLRRGISPENVYGIDQRPMCVKIARVNAAIATGIQDKAYYRRHFRLADMLKAKRLPAFTVALGCPPWEGGRGGAGASLCDEYVSRTLDTLPGHGIMRYVLPQSLLDLKSHEETRREMASCARIRQVCYLGPLAHCPGGQAVCLTAEKDAPGAQGAEAVQVQTPRRSFTIRRRMAPGDFSFDTDDDEHKLIEAIAGGSCFTLKDTASFGMGIVTGDNRTLVRHTSEGGAESVLRGSCVTPFRVSERGEYIVFDRSRFQQSPSLELFRSPSKILYRFVADCPVAAVDTKGRLTLNSCNFIIPQGGVAMCRYIAAVLNSAVMRFYFKKRFPAQKILRSHLEALPFPKAAPSKMEEVSMLSDRYYEADGRCAFERAVAALYGLDEKDLAALLAAGGRR